MIATEYRKLIVVAWVALVAAMAAIWGNDAWRGARWDTDDFMRLVQVRDWLSGQAWNDVTQYRLNPPAGTSMHWSRLPDVPLAGVALGLSVFLPVNDALAVAAMAVPPVYLLLFLVVYAMPARMLLGMARSPVGLLVAISGSSAVAQFAPGRVDHHGLQLVAMMAAIALLLFGLARQRWRKAIALAGIPIALSVWIGMEMLPIIAVWFVALGLIWCQRGGATARLAAAAAGIAALLGVALILTSTAQDRWLAPACDALSVMPVSVLALIAVGFSVMALLDHRLGGAIPRFAVAAVCGTGVAVAFAFAFPACLHGGYGDLDAEVVQYWLSNVSEAASLLDQFRTQPLPALNRLWTPLLALGYCIWRCARTGGRSRQLWGVLGLLLAVATALVFWQVRVVSTAHVIALLPLSALVADLWRKVRGNRAPRWRQFVVLLPVLFVCSVVLWPTIDTAYRFAANRVAGVSRPPTAAEADCTDRIPLPMLARENPTLILSYIDVGPMLLFSTPHAVLGAPYHRNGDGLRATIALFRSQDDVWIRDRLRQLGIGWIAVCPGPEDRSAYKTDAQNGLAERLVAGLVPSYLSEVAEPGHPTLKLYRVGD